VFENHFFDALCFFAMKAMLLKKIVSLDETEAPLSIGEVPRPEAGEGELLLKVLACGVCHTELDEIEGRTAPPRLPVILGHEVVGRVETVGSKVTDYKTGNRVGVGWIHSSCGGNEENLVEAFRATGRDVDGGYAEYMTVPASYAYPIPERFSDEEAAPLLCAGGIGYRALRLCGLEDGEPLGLMGFGGSAHLVLPLARHLYPESKVDVFARKAETRSFAKELGCDWAGDIEAPPPEPLRAIVDTTPAWKPIVTALRALAPGGRLVINAIRKEDRDKEALLDLNYHEDLWMEREIKSVANITRADLAEFLPIAAEIPLKPTTVAYPLERANEALMALRRGDIRGAAVLKP